MHESHAMFESERFILQPGFPGLGERYSCGPFSGLERSEQNKMILVVTRCLEGSLLNPKTVLTTVHCGNCSLYVAYVDLNSTRASFLLILKYECCCCMGFPSLLFRPNTDQLRDRNWGLLKRKEAEICYYIYSYC